MLLKKIYCLAIGVATLSTAGALISYLTKSETPKQKEVKVVKGDDWGPLGTWF